MLRERKSSDLKGKIALVTGAGGERGIGRAIALRFAEEGADVAVNDLNLDPRGDWGGLAKVAKEIEERGQRSQAITADVSKSDQVENMVRYVIKSFGKIDILVNNAGAPAGPDRVPVVELEESVFDLVYQVNVKGTFLCSRLIARNMIERGEGGKILNIASTAGFQGYARYAAYCSSKSAVVGFTKSLARELAPSNIHVNAICPGMIDTERLYGIASGLKPDNMSTEEYRERMIDSSVEMSPLGRIGRPEDVASVAAFLASSEGDYMIGQSISVSGGALMR
ncbi:MAG: Sorbitol dehydrogenase [Candidatus Moanabacter tarae]|uniref:Sorbitol dehydrogenase n=1 Tax=Candidatus Moanibacter tarae TaxID=2200854 RepID=A0A2Z4ACF0_9BACT|nr:MAG: Sorbitol dehydrogenase [Candidatus Moanabacter tarae]|tara:strand:- start:14915 stop:15757 length:843 start_codon:yes stop_codon:yes gene_type:complete